MQDSINKGLEKLKNKHAETNNKITEIKNTDLRAGSVSWKIKWWK